MLSPDALLQDACVLLVCLAAWCMLTISVLRCREAAMGGGAAGRGWLARHAPGTVQRGAPPLSLRIEAPNLSASPWRVWHSRAVLRRACEWVMRSQARAWLEGALTRVHSLARCIAWEHIDDDSQQCDHWMPTQARLRQVVVFDQATKLGYCVVWVHLDKHGSVEEAFRAGRASLSSLTGRLNALHPPLPSGRARPAAPAREHPHDVYVQTSLVDFT